MNYDVAKTYENMRAMADTDASKLGWTTKELQQQNFTLLTDMLRDLKIPLPGLKLHDAGCGTGDLLAFLKQKEMEPRHYIGTDFTAESIEIAKARFPSHDFLQMDLRTAHGYMPSLYPKADVTLIFGALAYHKPRDVEAMLNSLWNNTAVALGFNTWWQLHEGYVYHESIEQLRKCINRFLKNKQVHQVLGDSYGQPTEALFVVYR